MSLRTARRDREHLAGELLSGRVENEERLKRCLREPAEMTACAHRPDEDFGIEKVVGKPDAVPEQCAVRERARRVDGDHTDRALLLAQVADQGGDETRL